MPDWFKFCGKSCKDYGITVLEFPPLTTSEENITSVTVPGRAGDLEIRDGSYKSFELTLTCYIADLSNMAKIAAWLSARGPLILGNMPDRYYIARMTEPVEFEQIVRGRKQRRFDLPFWCQPFRYHVEQVEGEDDAILTSSPETVQNPGTYKSEPRIKIEGTGNVTLTIGTQILEVEDLDGGVIIDCKIKDCFNLTETALRNSSVTLIDDDFPTLQPGANIISWTGTGVTKITITPRWRDL